MSLSPCNRQSTITARGVLRLPDGTAPRPGTNPQTITLVGTASTDGGLIVDGAAGNRATISNFDYGSDASFSISFWAQKAECTTGPWEYIYSHAESTSLVRSHPCRTSAARPQ